MAIECGRFSRLWLGAPLLLIIWRVAAAGWTRCCTLRDLVDQLAAADLPKASRTGLCRRRCHPERSEELAGDHEFIVGLSARLCGGTGDGGLDGWPRVVCSVLVWYVIAGCRSKRFRLLAAEISGEDRGGNSYRPFASDNRGAFFAYADGAHSEGHRGGIAVNAGISGSRPTFGG